MFEVQFKKHISPQSFNSLTMHLCRPHNRTPLSASLITYTCQPHSFLFLYHYKPWTVSHEHCATLSNKWSTARILLLVEQLRYKISLMRPSIPLCTTILVPYHNSKLEISIDKIIKRLICRNITKHVAHNC